MIVLDASAVVEWLLGGDRGQEVERVLADAAPSVLAAPDLLDVEVLQTFRRLAREDVVTPGRAEATVDLLGQLPIDRHSCAPLGPRIWALRENLSAYDAAYVALAEALGCPLVTGDRRLASAPGHVAEVVVVGG